jgi:hypothetical protein
MPTALGEIRADENPHAVLVDGMELPLPTLPGAPAESSIVGDAISGAYEAGISLLAAERCRHGDGVLSTEKARRKRERTKGGKLYH